MLAYWKQRRRPGEGLGDFTARVGFDELRKFSAGYIMPDAEASLPTVALTQEVHSAMSERAAAQGKSLAHYTSEALRNFLGL